MHVSLRELQLGGCYTLEETPRWKKNALCVLSDLLDINKHVDMEKGEPLLQPDVYVGALLVSGLQVRS